MTNLDVSELNRLAQTVEDARAQMRATAKEMVSKGVKSLFEEYGDIVAEFGWTQYTPYFNDGDECVFGVGELSIIAKVDLEGLNEDELYDLRSEWSYEGSPAFGGYGSGKSRVTSRRGDKTDAAYDQRYQDAKDDIKRVHQIFNVDATLAKDLFGDHVQVIFTPEGVDTVHYDHE